LGCVAKLKERLDRESVKSKMRTSGASVAAGEFERYSDFRQDLWSAGKRCSAVYAFGYS
jgi:hypothetical protein